MADMIEQFKQFKVQRYQLYRELYQELVNRLTALGYSGPFAGPLLNPINTRTPETFYPPWLNASQRLEVKVEGLDDVKIGLLPSLKWQATIPRIFVIVPKYQRDHYIKSYPEEAERSGVSMYTVKPRAFAHQDVTALMGTVKAAAIKSGKYQQAHAAETAAGRGGIMIGRYGGHYV